METNCGAPVPGSAASCNRSRLDEHKTPTPIAAMTISSDIRTFPLRTRIHLLEDELHSHLHDSRIGCGQNAAETRIRQRRARVARVYMVRGVKRLGPEFNGLLFANFECANHAEINTDHSWSGYTFPPDFSGQTGKKFLSYRFPVERTELGNQVEVPGVFRLNGEAVTGD